MIIGTLRSNGDGRANVHQTLHIFYVYLYLLPVVYVFCVE